ncbi:MAG: DUF3793 family protein [Firmicutes bacterium]|nr:DUF3793 family protein [Bacillota bacterium]
MSIEQLAVYHCAPVLSGIKPSNIVTCDKSKIKSIHTQIDALKKELSGKNVTAEILFECERYILLIVYRPNQLRAYLSRADVREFLRGQGYGGGTNIRKYLDILKSRIARNGDFPHEIGIFLGYPLADVVGFIKNGGRNCKMSGVWKVYDNVYEASCVFEKIEKCKKAYAKHFSMGRSLSQLTAAG